MTYNGVAIKYGDYALGAKEDFAPEVSEKESFVDLSQLQQSNLEFKNYANPCELYQTLLNGKSIALPEDLQGENTGLWSVQLSDINGIFADPIVLEYVADGQYKSQGFSFTFDEDNNIYCNHLKIEWYRSNEQIDAQDFYPDNAFYFCQKRVDNFDKVIIRFYSLNLPHNRLKLHVVDWGYGTIFRGDELLYVNVKQTLDPISSDIAINTCNFKLSSKRNINYSFQVKQPLTLYNRDKLIGTFFVKTSTRHAKRSWEVQTEDYIGIMEDAMFEGDIYVDKNVGELLAEIFSVAKVPYEVAEDIASMTVSGHIPYCTCRKALMLVAFATLSVVDTSNSDVIKVSKLSTEVSQTIPLKRIMQGQNFENGEVVTHVMLTIHDYVQSTEESEVEKLYEATQEADNVLVRFDSPVYGLTITKGTIHYSTANYAVIYAKKGCVLKGIRYADNTTEKEQQNDVVLVNESENKMQITDATLVTSSNADAVLSHCFEWLTKVDAVNLDIVEGKHVSGGDYVLFGNSKFGAVKYNGKLPVTVTYDKAVNVGDLLTCETEYLGTITGRLIEQSFNISGNSIVKKAVIK